MNIPQDTLQQVADAAFTTQGRIILVSCPDSNNIWNEQDSARRDVIQHAISNPALAPFLAGGGEYTDSDIHCAWRKAVESDDKFVDRIRAFLDALPRRESPVLAEALARAEKAEAELAALKVDMSIAKRAVDNVMRILPEMVKSPSWEDAATSVREHIDKLENELATLRAAELGILRPISEMPGTVPDGCMAVFRWRDDFGSWVTGTCEPTNGFFTILRLPDAEATPPAQPAAQVPLGPEDCPPGSVVRCDTDHWFQVLYASPIGVCINNVGLPVQYRWIELAERWQINYSIPDTGRWDANAWRPCSKPGK